MPDNYTMLIDLGVGFLQMFLGKLANKAPAEVVTALQASIDALEVHKNDEITKANFEAQRG